MKTTVHHARAGTEAGMSDTRHTRQPAAEEAQNPSALLPIVVPDTVSRIPSPAAQAPLHACTQKEGKTADPCTHSAAHRRTTTLGRADTEKLSASAPPAVLHAHKHAHTRHCAGHTRAQAVAQCSFLVLLPLSLRARSCRRGRRWRRPWGRRRAGRTRDGRRR